MFLIYIYGFIMCMGTSAQSLIYLYKYTYMGAARADEIIMYYMWTYTEVIQYATGEQGEIHLASLRVW